MIMRGAEIVVKTLIEQGAKVIFGYPGGTVLDIYDEIYKHSDELTHVLTAHEQGAAHAADGYARSTGRVGVCIATSGPGATNLVTGIATAYLDSIPLVAITGNVGTAMIGKDAFQEVDITGVTMPITKHNFFVNSVDKLADTIREAFRLAKSGRPGPVLVDIPKDVQNAVCEYEKKAFVEPEKNKPVDDEQVKAALEIIGKAERPYILIGGGAITASAGDEAVELADKIDAYIGSTMMGLSAVPTANERFLGMVGMHGHYAATLSMYNCDCLITVGARFSDRATGNTKKFLSNAKKIHIDIDNSEIDKNIKVDVGVVGDVADVLQRLIKGLDAAKHPEWEEKVSEFRKKEAEKDPEDKRFSPKNIIKLMDTYLAPGTAIATDVGQNQMWAAQYAKFEKPRKFISSGGLGTMGFGLGAAIGAAYGSGERSVLVTGDGGFGMCLTEMATAVTNHVPVVILLLNNTVLGMVRQWQSIFYGKRYSNTDLKDRHTDFVKLAEAFGGKGKRCTNLDEAKAAFDEAFKEEGPYIVECMIGKDECVLPMIPAGGTVTDLITEIKIGN
ncbi:MAG: biosynthetic-type acetolactate synthase large subunit [Lachnospiraceae bacterium]|nr:biosynthetic-type acetolactate synthase large subunit [Lachnospiraceae bacterium]